MPEFGTLFPDGSYEPKGRVEQSDIQRCPHMIILWEHYREDGSCKCNDPDHKVMLAWGYAWDVPTQQWVAPLEVEE